MFRQGGKISQLRFIIINFTMKKAFIVEISP